jgi:hypothetical protein
VNSTVLSIYAYCVAVLAFEKYMNNPVVSCLLFISLGKEVIAHD